MVLTHLCQHSVRHFDKMNIHSNFTLYTNILLYLMRKSGMNSDI
jgi:hypothetical protein